MAAAQWKLGIRDLQSLENEASNIGTLERWQGQCRLRTPLQVDTPVRFAACLRLVDGVAVSIRSWQLVGVVLSVDAGEVC